MVSIKLLLPVLGATAIAAATVQDVVQDVTKIDDGVKKLIPLVKMYPGGFLPAAPQLITLVPVFTALLKGDADTALLPPSISLADAYLIIEHVNKTLAIDNPAAVAALKAKKNLYANAGLASFLATGLGLLKLGHEVFTTNVLKVFPPEAVDDGKSVALVISLALQDGIDTFAALS